MKADFNEKILLRAIAQVLKNSKDWEGGRSERDPKNKSKILELRDETTGDKP